MRVEVFHQHDFVPLRGLMELRRFDPEFWVGVSLGTSICEVRALRHEAGEGAVPVLGRSSPE